MPKAWPVTSMLQDLVATQELYCEAMVDHHGDSFEDNPAMRSRS